MMAVAREMNTTNPSIDGIGSVGFPSSPPAQLSAVKKQANPTIVFVLCHFRQLVTLIPIVVLLFIERTDRNGANQVLLNPYQWGLVRVQERQTM